ncbi:MAG: helix-turn-helix transcriptional regulator [Bacillaceae bacterium]
MPIKTIVSMIDWIEENIEDNPTLEKMSSFVGYSSFYCSAKFHEYVGVSFKEYLIKRKLALAAFELQQSKGRIIDVALKYGFSSHEAFTRAFFRVYGYTPYQFRKLSPSIPLHGKAQIVDHTPCI